MSTILGRGQAPDRAHGTNAEPGARARAPPGPFPLLPLSRDASARSPATPVRPCAHVSLRAP
jgi:hypothetical protein